MVVLPVFLQAPWVRVHPFSATLFTALLLAIGVVLNRSDNQQKADFGSLLVGFSGSWLAGCVFWGWLRAHPVLHWQVWERVGASPLPFICLPWWVQLSPI